MTGDRTYPRVYTVGCQGCLLLPLTLTISEFQTNQALAGLLYFACPCEPDDRPCMLSQSNACDLLTRFLKPQIVASAAVACLI